MQVTSVQDVERWHERRVCMRTGVATATLVSSSDQNTPLTTSSVAVAAAGSVVHRQQMALPSTQKPSLGTAVTERTFKPAYKLPEWRTPQLECRRCTMSRHSSAPGLALVTGFGKNTVLTGRTGFLLSQLQGAFISRWRASLDWRGGITTSTTVRFLSTPDRSANPAQHHL